MWLFLIILLFSPLTFSQDGQKAKLSQEVYDKAFKLLQEGKAMEALTTLDLALSQFPVNPILHNLRGLVVSQLGRDKEAEASFRKVIELAPRSAMGYNNLATVLSQRGRAAEARQLFEQALQREPQNFTSLLGLGVTLATLQKYSEAVPFLEKAWLSRPQDFQTGYELARALRELKRSAEARKILASIPAPSKGTIAARYFTLAAVLAEDQADNAAAVSLYRRAYELAPGSFEIYLALTRASLGSAVPASDRTLPPAPAHLSAEQHFALGLLFASRRAYPEAVSHFAQTLQMEPASYSTAYNLAVSYKGAGETEAAIKLIESRLENHSTAEFHNLLASLQESVGHYVEAVRHYQKAVELEATNEQYYFDLGLEYLAHFTFGPAIEVFQVGIKKFPNASRQYEGKGLAHYAMREYPQAADAFLTALEMSPSSPSAFAAWNALQSALEPLELERVLPRLKSLSQAHPQNAEAMYCYGQALLNQSLSSNQPEQMSPAQALIEEACRLKPDFAAAHLVLGNLYLARKEPEKAIVAFQETIRLDARNEMAYYRLGQTYRNLNQLELAQQQLALHAQLVKTRRELMARSRSAIKQFVLAQSGSQSGTVIQTPSAP